MVLYLRQQMIGINQNRKTRWANKKSEQKNNFRLLFLLTTGNPYVSYGGYGEG